MYIFSFSFSEVSSVKYHNQSHWLNWKWMLSATNLPPPYLLVPSWGFASVSFSWFFFSGRSCQSARALCECWAHVPKGSTSFPVPSYPRVKAPTDERTGQFAGCRLSRLNLQVEFAGQIYRSNLQVRIAGQICRLKNYKKRRTINKNLK